MNLGLTNKVAMVAGASRGLGYAVARALAEEGAQVSIASRDADAVAAAGKKIEEETGRACSPSRPMFRRRSAIEQWHQKTIERFGGIDLLFTNSGGPPPGAALGVRRRGVAESVRAAADERGADDPPRGAVDGGARRRKHRSADVEFGERADREPGSLEYSARLCRGVIEDTRQ